VTTLEKVNVIVTRLEEVNVIVTTLEKVNATDFQDYAILSDW